MQAFKCPHCGGDVKYDAGAEAMSCVHCGSEIRREDYQRYLEENALYATNELVCPQCGAALLSYDDTLSSFCCYCGSAVSFTRRIVEDSKPEQIVPFKLNRAQALKHFRDRMARSVFAPDWLEEGESERLVGLYMPYYSYNVTARAKISGEAQDLHGGGYECYQVDGELLAQYQELRFDAAEAFPDCLSATLDEKAAGERSLAAVARPFETSYLAGFYADGGSVREEDYRQMLEGMVRTDLAQQKLNYKGADLLEPVKDPELELEQRKFLYPVWLNTHRKGDRVCYAAIDGENGNVAAELPVDGFKFLKIALLLTALFALALNGLFTIPPLEFLCVAGALLVLMGRLLVRERRDVLLRQAHRDDVGRIGLEEFRREARSRPRRVRHMPVGFLSFGWFLIFGGFLVMAGTILLLFLTSSFSQKAILVGALLVAGGGLDLILVCTAEALMRPSRQRRIPWRFRMKPLELLRSLWRTLLGSALAAAVLFWSPVQDEFYYAAGVLDLLLAVWSALDLIRQHNLLCSREIPAFTRKRGGAADA